jgi:hypothetical protein
MKDSKKEAATLEYEKEPAVFSSRSILSLASLTNLAPHGSGTHAPSICFFRRKMREI